MSYKLYFPILLPVENVLENSAAGLTHKKVADALRNMADRIEHDELPLENSIGREPIHAEQEDRWVMCSVKGHHEFKLGDPVWICAPGGGWSKLRSRDIREKHTMTSDEAIHLGPLQDVVFSRPEDLGGRPVLAELRDQCETVLGLVDMRSWMAWADEDVLSESVRNDWMFSLEMLDPLDEPDNPLHNEPTIRRGYSRIGDVKLVIAESEREYALEFLENLRPGFTVALDSNASPSVEM